jgi:demethylmacrocin O-methyltransferase
MSKIKFDTPLCELAHKYGSDKCAPFHGYTPRYYKMFHDKRKDIKKVLEIGVGTPSTMLHVKKYKVGSSLYMWRDYFPNAQIYGIDIAPECIFKDDRIETFYCDQSDREGLARLMDRIGEDIDIVIDDGSHIPEHQIITCLTLMPFLSKSVVYVIEDVGDTTIFNTIRYAGWNVWYKMLRIKFGHSDRMALVRYPPLHGRYR